MDVCVYGGTASGVTAALAAAQHGKSVIIVEPHRTLGGIVGGGIRIQRDCLYPNDIGGITKQLLNDDNALGGGAHEKQPELRAIIAERVRAAQIRTLLEHRLASTVVDEGKIRRVRLDYAPLLEESVPPAEPKRRDAVVVEAAVFIDASYEGDLMAQAGVTYVVGRESRDEFKESLGGQRHLVTFDISPYIVPWDPSSGLLPMIDSEPFREGQASRHIIAYNFRPLWVVNGTPVPAPRNFDRVKYALAIRSFEARKGFAWPHDNYERRSLISGGIPGAQSEYPEASWARRSEIWRDWIEHLKTLHQISGSTLQLQRGQYPDNGDIPDQLYIRLGRRMRGPYIMTQHDLMHQTEIPDSIGLGFYKVDIYPCRLVAHEGKVASEGETFVRVSPGPYQISYRALTPKKTECENLLVPVCISASHVALSSIRMEPTYMVMGESAGIAAALAVDAGRAVQDLDPKALQAALLKAGVIVEWNGRGYGPGNDVPWWKTTPEDYTRKPIRLDPIWEAKSAMHARREWASLEEWNRTKPGWAWLYPHVDRNGDGSVSSGEYEEFQRYKQLYPDWQKRLKSAQGRK